METRAQAAGPVKRFSDDPGTLDAWNYRKVRLSEMSLRINGYLNGCFNRGAKYIIWDKHRFARAISKGKPRKLSHIEQAMTAFRKETTNWHFEEIYYRGPARGEDSDKVRRKHRRLKITPAGRGLAPSQLEVTTRFLAYVTAAARANGSVRVGRPFLVQFWKTTGLPEEWIRIAWQRMRKIRGYRVKWRGKGAGVCAVVSMPYFSRRSSSPYGEKIKNRGPVPGPGFLKPGSSAADAARDPGPWGVPAADAAEGGKAPSPLPPPPGGVGNFPSRSGPARVPRVRSSRRQWRGSAPGANRRPVDLFDQTA